MKTENTKFEIDLIINKFMAAFEHINNSLNSHDDEIKDLLIKYKHKELYDMGLMFSEIHVIDCIGKTQLINATSIAKELNMTKGAISKITNKLLRKELIKGNHLENNKKEIYYALTAQGKEVFKIHEMLHKVKHEKFIKILSKYDKEGLNIINSFIDDLISEI
ncbi:MULTISPECIES: MarR family transcriptional regulator [Clostridium]|uniref:MarR family protein n=2 Tax=Clostridium TaxID=1485 RepID=D8GTP5_CLOLD|nr:MULTISPECIES: MarR family transcriptional regulator [Clostridium]ADK14694.1 predicted transcriptional regulator, marR family [Clostridium ljungdahlii DSM 13528]AGY77927.1 MarR family transcriptional regulator [Clostridium autoethanogenum DSM 10061]ALU38060.1 Transcriptional regulator MarR family [Clostridium autoethanogenum DSM 10061]OAA85931.1 MarR family protein [Clostridium ljungdahlii DSM 13528]OVY50824.1 MarR family protein [Clostridium autoethanogenum]